MELFPSVSIMADLPDICQVYSAFIFLGVSQRKTPRLAGGSLLGAVSLAVAYKLYRLATL
jgi:hypothetical protein